MTGGQAAETSTHSAMRSRSPAMTAIGASTLPTRHHSLPRRAPAALADSVRNGDTQVTQVHGGSAAAQLSAIPDVRTARSTLRVMQFTLRANVPKLADTQVRKAILGLLDVTYFCRRGRRHRQHRHLDQAQICSAE